LLDHCKCASHHIYRASIRHVADVEVVAMGRL
jgi:hypothetical protein